MKRPLWEVKADLRRALSMYGTACDLGEPETIRYMKRWVEACEQELIAHGYGRVDVHEPTEVLQPA
ncbi:MAG: hypothetical protein AMS18_10295 [Gemmatimonas sp. SG8_17]|nr:MAG: hypothetical protein AMS18_10295 [Gemmatimonas sp. SG8_17]